jgi:hypothetical protein
MLIRTFTEKLTTHWSTGQNIPYVQIINTFTFILDTFKSRIMRWAGHGARMGRREECTGFWWGNLSERYHWEYPGIDGRIIIIWIFIKWDVGGVDWIELAKDRDRWRALVNGVMNLRVQ